MSRANKELARTVLCILGTLLLYAGNYAGLLFSLIGLALVLIGSYLWMSLKNRHWAFTLFGIAAPLGFIVLAVLKDKTPKPQEAKAQ